MVLRIRFPEAAALSELPLCLALPCAAVRRNPSEIGKFRIFSADIN